MRIFYPMFLCILFIVIVPLCFSLYLVVLMSSDFYLRWKETRNILHVTCKKLWYFHHIFSYSRIKHRMWGWTFFHQANGIDSSERYVRYLNWHYALSVCSYHILNQTKHLLYFRAKWGWYFAKMHIKVQ